jgi:hypothetical protein
MNFDSKVHRPSRRRLLVPVLAALAFAAGQTAVADTPAPSMIRTAAPMQSPLPHGTEGGNDELIVMLCRRGVEPGKTVQEMPQELPLLCLVTQTDEETLQMGPARFQDLLDRAVNSGQMTVLVLRPQ